MNQDELNNKAMRDIIDICEKNSKELSLKGHDLRISHLEKLMKFMATDCYFDYLKEKMKDKE